MTQAEPVAELPVEVVEDLESKLDEGKAAADALAQRLAESQSQAQAVELAQVRERLAQAEAKRAAEDAAAARAELATIKAKAAVAEAHRQAERFTALQAERDEARKQQRDLVALVTKPSNKHDPAPQTAKGAPGKKSS